MLLIFQASMESFFFFFLHVREQYAFSREAPGYNLADQNPVPSLILRGNDFLKADRTEVDLEQ